MQRFTFEELSPAAQRAAEEDWQENLWWHVGPGADKSKVIDPTAMERGLPGATHSLTYMPAVFDEAGGINWADERARNLASCVHGAYTSGMLAKQDKISVKAALEMLPTKHVGAFCVGYASIGRG